MRQLVLLLAAASSAANVKQLPPKWSWCEQGTEDPWTTPGYPTTESWPEEATNDDSWTEEPTTTEDYTTTTASDAGCPLGWIGYGKLGCFLFAPQMAGLSWLEALEYCEEQDGFLAEPKTEEQLNFLTSLAYVEEMATGVQGWWVGLADLGHEGEWVWQVDREDADITAWDSGCPDMSEHNSRDCAALISITVKEDKEEKQLAARYRDLPCMLPVEEIQVAPICQRGGLSAGSTTVATTTETTTERPECPDGWETYTGDSSHIKCYKYCGDTQYATWAEDNCKYQGGHLASIHSVEEQNFIVQTFNPSGNVWIGAVDYDHDGVWEWTDGSSFDFSYWIPGSEPDGGSYNTFMDIAYYSNGYWNDGYYSSHYYGYICQLTL